MPGTARPATTPDDDWFWRGVDEGKLLLRRCANCSRLQHPPTPMCPECGSLEWATQEASGHGTVHSWIVSHHPSHADDLPRIVVLVDLDEGVRLVSNLRDVALSDVRNDMEVAVTFAEVDGVKLPQFRAAEQ